MRTLKIDEMQQVAGGANNCQPSCHGHQNNQNNSNHNNNHHHNNHHNNGMPGNSGPGNSGPGNSFKVPGLSGNPHPGR